MKFASIQRLKELMLVFFFTLFTIVPAAAPVLAQNLGDVIQGGPDLGSQYPAYSGLSDVDPRITAARIIRVAMGFLGTVFVGLTLYGGFIWMTAGGNEENIGKAKKFITSGVIGLAIILSSYAIAFFVTTRLVAATST
jgi:hypothetical protein